MIKGIQNLVGAQVEVNRAVFASNDFDNEKRLDMTQEELKLYLIATATRAIKDLTDFLNKQK
jgi:hypothetical protein